MNAALKIKVFFLAMVFPISFLLAGWLIGENSYLLGFDFHNTGVTLLLSGVGFLFGALLNVICYYRKVFAIALYQTPIPLTLFFASWWIVNSLVNTWLAISIGFLFLLVGLWINSVIIIPYQFFRIKKRVLALLYVFYSIVILGLFMGVPLFNILMGVFAGNYLAIRTVSYVKLQKTITKNIRQGALFSSIVILFVSILASLMAFVDLETYLQTFTSLTQIPINAEKFFLFLVIAVLIGVLLQYFVTWFTATTMLQLHNHKKLIHTKTH